MVFRYRWHINTKFYNIYNAVIDTQQLKGNTAEIGILTGSTLNLFII